MVLAVSAATAAFALVAAPAEARVDPVVPTDPFESSPGSCIVPAVHADEGRCSAPRSPDPFEGAACNLPVVYLGGPPGPCPEPDAPPESRIVPIGPAALSR